MNIPEFLEKCRIDGTTKIDTTDDSFWKLKELLEHYDELKNNNVKCNVKNTKKLEKFYPHWGFANRKEWLKDTIKRGLISERLIIKLIYVTALCIFQMKFMNGLVVSRKWTVE